MDSYPHNSYIPSRPQSVKHPDLRKHKHRKLNALSPNIYCIMNDNLQQPFHDLLILPSLHITLVIAASNPTSHCFAMINLFTCFFIQMWKALSERSSLKYTNSNTGLQVQDMEMKMYNNKASHTSSRIRNPVTDCKITVSRIL